VRSAIIRTVNGITSRPNVKLFPLEVNAESETTVRNAQDVSNDKDDHTQDTPGDSGPQMPSRPKRSASVKARAQVANWAQILRGPKDVGN